MYRIGSRIVKTALGSAVAIFIAQSVGVHFYASAGTLTILCIQTTKKRSLDTALRRFSACVLIILFCIFFFHIFGYTPLAIGLLLLFFIPSLVKLKIQEGVISSAVIMLHLYGLKNITSSIIVDELTVIVIGIGVALLCNLYMPSLDNQIKSFKVQIDSKFCFIFEKISIYLKEPANKCFLEEYDETVKLLQEAKRISKLEIDNHYFKSSNDEDYEYFLLRERQLEIIHRIIDTVCDIKVSNEQSHILSKFFNDLSFSINPIISGAICLYQLEEIYGMFRAMPLPQTSDDFETRASVLTIINEMESFLILKSKFKGKYAK